MKCHNLNLFGSIPNPGLVSAGGSQKAETPLEFSQLNGDDKIWGLSFSSCPGKWSKINSLAEEQAFVCHTELQRGCTD